MAVRIRPRASALFFARTPGCGCRTILRTYSSSLDNSPQVDQADSHVSVRCGLSGEVMVSLFNIASRPPDFPLLIYLPPTSPLFLQPKAPSHELPPWTRIPSFLLHHRQPTAVINYRWPRLPHPKDRDPDINPEHCWPTPMHDVAAAYRWIITNLSPDATAPTPSLTSSEQAGRLGREVGGEDVRGGGGEDGEDLRPSPDSQAQPPHLIDRDGFLRNPDRVNVQLDQGNGAGSGGDGRRRRDIYVYGSQLGGGLAAALALTEARPAQPMTIKGLVTLNGIYNWVNIMPRGPLTRDGEVVTEGAWRSKQRRKSAGVARPSPGRDDSSKTSIHPSSNTFDRLAGHVTDLFRTPADLFDPFASPSLFFHNVGFLPPSSFWRDEYRQLTLPVRIDRVQDELLRRGEEKEDRDLGHGFRRMPRNPWAHWTLPRLRTTFLHYPPGHQEEENGEYFYDIEIPDTLLLHDKTLSRQAAKTLGRQAANSADGTKKQGRAVPQSRRRYPWLGFEGQALHLARLMRRSIDTPKPKPKQKPRDDHEMDYERGNHKDPSAKARRRVMVQSVDDEHYDDGESSEAFLRDWLGERIGW